MNTGTVAVQSKAGLLTTLAYKFGDEKPHYALEEAIAITGALGWYDFTRSRILPCLDAV